VTTDSFVQVAPDSSGKKIDNSQVTVAPIADPQNANTVQRQRVSLADPNDPTGVAPVLNRTASAVEFALPVRMVPDRNFAHLTQDQKWDLLLEKFERLLEAVRPVSLSDAPVISAIPETAFATVGGVLVQPQYAKANIAASQTDSQILAAVGGKIIRVLAFRLMAGGTATTFTFNTKSASAGVACTEAFACGANGGINSGLSQVGHFQTNVSEGLTATTGAGSTVGVGIVYILVPVFALPPLI
jgi:hypothetical protein